MESLELGRRLKRNCDNLTSKKRLALAVIFVLVTLFYIVPYVSKWFGFGSSIIEQDVVEVCLRDRLTSFNVENEEFNVNIVHIPPSTNQSPFVGYIGNGYIGVDVVNGGEVYIRTGRSLSLQTGIHPILTIKNQYGSHRSAYIINYLTGIVHVFKCYESGFYASFQYYAHRRLSTLIVQEIKLSNPTDRSIDIGLETNTHYQLHNPVSRTIDVKDGDGHLKYNLSSGYIINPLDDENLVIPVTVGQRSTPVNVKVDARSSKQITVYTALSYSNPTKKTAVADSKVLLEKNAVNDITKASNDPFQTKENHAHSWQDLWSTGFSISTSKAKDILNGAKINATMYYVLSQVKDESDPQEVANHLSYAEGCYGNHHTLEATNLWGSLDTVDGVNRIVSYWLLTLEKNGCHNILRAGGLGVVQAMVLSFGGLRFSNQHLEFNIDPKYLHREYMFRRIAYGNRTHVNITVAVQEDNKAILRVALDRSDKNYYACDGGCLDTPVQLGPDLVTFPVKLTEPLTPILYITYDKQHMEELRNAIHVREIAEAPAHEHNVIALHKHGHHLGGLPTFFWVSVSFLILIFHLFLFKLIYNEYCSGSSFERQRFRYGKL